MTIDLTKTTFEILEELAEKLFAEAPDVFRNAIATTETQYIHTENKQLIFSSFKAKRDMADFFKENPTNDGTSLLLEKDENGEHQKIFGISDKALNRVKDKERNIFNFLHEAMHVAKLTEIKNDKNRHYHEAFADIGAYLLFKREIGAQSKFLEHHPFSNTPHLLKENLYDLKGTYYTTDAMLAAKHVAEKIDVTKLNYDEIVNLSEIIAKEFAHPQSKLDKLHDKIENTANIVTDLNRAIYSKNKDIYRVGRHFSLMKEFKEASEPRTEKLLQQKDEALELIMDPIDAKLAIGETSPTEKIINKIITVKPEFAV